MSVKKNIVNKFGYCNETSIMSAIRLMNHIFKSMLENYDCEVKLALLRLNRTL